MGKMENQLSEFQVPQRFRWPRLVHLDEVDKQLLRIRPQQRFETKLHFLDANLKFRIPVASNPEQLERRLILKFGRNEIILNCSNDFFPKLLDKMGYRDDIHTMSPASAALTANLALLRLLQQQKEWASLKPRVMSYEHHEGPAPKISCAFSLIDDRGTIETLTISGKVSVLGRVIQILTNGAKLEKREIRSNICLPVRVFAPKFETSIKTLRSLKVGDGMSLPLKWEMLEKRKVIISSHLQINIERTDDDWRCIGEPSTISENQEEGARKFIMSDISKQKEPANDLPIIVNLMVAETKVTLAELEQICDGNILPFHQKLTHLAKLMIGDDVFAEGELVKLDGNVAVRLTRIL
jgi:flagellar motor switch/type III secretory pathway protein FliN